MVDMSFATWISQPSLCPIGIINLPYAEIEEPFEAWYNHTGNKSRIEYYDGKKQVCLTGERVKVQTDKLFLNLWPSNIGYHLPELWPASLKVREAVSCNSGMPNIENY